MTQSSIDRFTALVVRELHAEGASVFPRDGENDGEQAIVGANVIVSSLADGRRVVVTFSTPLADAEPLLRRLDLLIHTFPEWLDEGGGPSAYSESRHSLRGELRALVARARAVDAAVIDARSPVVWGSAWGENTKRPPPIESASEDLSGLLPSQNDAESFGGPAPANEVKLEHADPTLLLRAIENVRAISSLDSLHKGGHLRHIVLEPEGGYTAHSFAGIYVLVVVFDGLYDEIRAERAVLDALPMIERLVLALPSIDPPPSPVADVISLRARRTKRG